jgi:hypothetical protein
MDSGKIFKDDVNGLFSSSAICFIGRMIIWTKTFEIFGIRLLFNILVPEFKHF